VDAVKALANQLKLQLAQAPQKTPADENYRKAQSEIQTLESEIKSGDAQKAETAFATASQTLKTLQTQSAQSSRSLDAYG
jgi:hypothetical protein